MTKEQGHLLQLLAEFHQICGQLNIPYYLIGHQLLLAERKEGIRGYEADIAMFLDDWKIMEDAAKKTGKYDTEFAPDFDSSGSGYFRFVDRSTLMLDLDCYGEYSKPGVAINVFIFQKNRRGHRLRRAMNRQQKVQSELVKYNSSRRKGRVSVSEGSLKRIRARVEQGSAGKKDGLCHLVERGRMITLKRSELGRGKSVLYNDVTLDAFQKTTPYLKRRFGENWKDVVPDFRIETYRCVFSKHVAYEEYLEQVRKNGISLADLSEIDRRYSRDLAAFERLVEEEEAGWSKTLFLAGERFRLWKKYMPMKERLQEFFQKERYDQVDLFLQDYVRTLEEYLEKAGVVICFDEDILNMVIALYRRNGWEEIADEIREKVLPEDLKPMTAEMV